MSVLTLNAIMNLDASKFTSGLSNAQKSFSTASTAISTGMKGLATVSAAAVAGVVAIGGAAVTAGTKLYSMAVGVSDLGDAIDKGSQKLQISSDLYQKLSYACDNSGTSIDSLKKGIINITSDLADMQNGVDGADSKFSAIGVTLTNADGTFKTTEQVLLDTIDSLAGMTDETQRNAAAQDIFGKSYTELIPLLNEGSDGISALMQECEDFGMVMSEDTVKASAEFNDSLTKLKGTATGLKNALVGQLLPGLTKITDGLAALLKGDKTATEQIKQGAKDVISTVKTLVPQAMEILGTIAEAVLEAGPEILQGLVDGIGQALPGVMQAITTLFSVYLPQLVPQILPILSTVLSTLIQNIATFVPPLLITLLTFIANELPNLIQTILPAIVQMIQVLLEALPGLITTLVPILVNVVIMLLDTLLTQVLPVILDNLVPILDAIVTALLDNLPVLLDGVLNIITKLSDMIMNGDGLSQFINAIFTLIGKIAVKAPEFTAQLIGILFNILVELVVLIIATGVEMFNTLVDLCANAIGTFADLLSPVGNWVKEHVIDPAVNFFTNAWNTVKTGVTNAWNAVKTLFSTVASWYYNSVIMPVQNFFQNSWNNIKNFAVNAWNTIRNTFSVVSSWYYNSVIAPVQNFFTNMWNNLKTGASNAWTGIKNVFGTVANFFQSTFQNAWNKVKQVFSSGGAIFQGIASGIYESFKNIVNSLISGINSVIYTPFSKIRSAINTIKSLSIGGVYPFSGLPNISIPSIPYLAKGGLITSPTFAMVGEQGTEAVIPLDRDTKALDLIADRLKNNQDLSPLVEAIKQMKIYLDSGVLVGAVSDQMDTAFGIRQVQVSRGVTV